MSNASGCAGIAGATINASAFGVPYASTVADANGNYSIALSSGAETSTLTPSLAGFTFSPASSDVVFPGSAGINFQASNSSAWSPEDCRDSANYPNSSINENGSQIYTVPATDSRVDGPPVDSRADVPEDCRVSKTQNSRVAPPFGEAGEP
jgi:hypothetical protein